MQTSFGGRIVTRQHVLDAMSDFDQRYANTEEYVRWLSSKTQKHVVRHNGQQYPPKLILCLATHFNVTDFKGGEEVNYVFRDLGFEVIKFRSGRSLLEQILSLIVDKKPEVDNSYEEPFIPGFSAQQDSQEHGEVPAQALVTDVSECSTPEPVVDTLTKVEKVSLPTHFDLYTMQLEQNPTLWMQLQDKLNSRSADYLKSVLLTSVANNIRTVRARNALLRKMPSDYTLYDLMMSTDEELLKVPNLGVKSLEDLKQELVDLLNHLLSLSSSLIQQAELLPPILAITPDPKLFSTGKSTGVANYDWQMIRQLVNKLLTSRHIDILQAYYGQYQIGETLAIIGDRLGLTRERVRQIKSKASTEFRRQISAEMAALAFHDYALAKLAQVGAEATPAVIWTATEDSRIVAKDELWLLNWFRDMYGHDWYTRWIAAGGLQDQGKLQAVTGLAAVSAVVNFLGTYSYRPLSREEALAVAHISEPSISAYDLYIRLEEHPDVRLFRYGDLQIGHVSWRWFNPQRSRESRQVEWALRLMHAPASPEEIARVIRERLGVIDVSAFYVADACDRNPKIFFQQDDIYGLVIWKRASTLRQPLMNLLANGSLSLPEIVDLWGRQYGSSSNAELVFAALHHFQDSFCSIKPLYWARKDVASKSFDDPSLFSFENLMPTL